MMFVLISTPEKLKKRLATVGIEPTTFGMLAQCSATRLDRFEYVMYGTESSWFDTTKSRQCHFKES